MQRRAPRRRRSGSTVALIGVFAGILALHAAAAVPPGYRYIGSRSVSAGRVVLWYWNADIVELDAGRAAFTAHLYARAPDVGQERPYLAVVRCDNRTYRPAMETGPFQPIDDGEPIAAVWRAGCANGVAVDAAQRRARLDGTGSEGIAAATPRGTHGASGPAPSATAASATAASATAASATAASATAPSATAPSATAPSATAASATAASATAPAATAPAATAASASGAAPPSAEPADPRRADACVRLSDAKGSPAGEAAITNGCRYPVEVSLCYKGGGGGPYDCAASAKGRLSDSLGSGTSHVLPEYRRSRHRGIAAVACRGTPGTVFPRLDESGQSGCF